ncbi:GNAT family N-acetyltransferase [Caryophanon tenue]|uniref:N-acetyltransferase domain-containing protein n=1 Tax=Caryophanon tenue TaxID=33978 RepID=A0A1C0YKT5_9BACL|nr:GNAT family N-acetyltransferase [Caryophanon tenue]OCS87778.1 hypothetical protein A6M13_10790 [Caryophanon tenue]
MLYRYKKAFEKLAMGLLSFNPAQKDLKKLQETMARYEEDEQWHLYLWKQDDEYLGLIGVQYDNETAYVQHISVMPSHRGEGIARCMIEAVEQLPGVSHVVPLNGTAPLVEKCTRQS